jgi:hypothetical protein
MTSDIMLALNTSAPSASPSLASTRPSPMRDILTIAGAFVLFVTAFLLGAHLSRSEVRLVGYNCVGASGPLYAAEEDHFPQCLSIEEI